MACRVPDAEALEIIRKGASRIVTVNDHEIKAAIRHLFSDTHNAAEGAGAALAGLIQEGERMRGCRVAAILTGCNIDRDVFAQILTGK
jgi:threonine dehydratase